MTRHVIRFCFNSEINFLTHYLALEKFYSDTFDYQIVSDRALTGVLIPPLLLVPITQYALKRTVKQDKRPSILLQADREGEEIHITCRFDDQTEPDMKELDSLKARLELLYPRIIPYPSRRKRRQVQVPLH